MSLNGSAQSIGSPSRMRGKEGDELGLGQTIRITPACAGKRAGPNNSLTGNQDHPRVCGEKLLHGAHHAKSWGSPPHVRGKALHFNPHRTGFGITPAYAGKSSRNETCWHRPWDHPRVCGEKPDNEFDEEYFEGSPPRMRGKGVVNVLVSEPFRITPACAGKRPQMGRWNLSMWDHPRVCGEKCPPGKFFFMTVGSSPRMRGKAFPARWSARPAWITPAYAGKSRLRCPVHRFLWDHPRVCEEKGRTKQFLDREPGSPPRVREKALLIPLHLYFLGITPACAGKSSIQHLTASLGEFKVQKGHPVPHLRQRLQVWPDHARHLRHGLILHASRSAGQGRRLCPGPCPDTAGSGTPRGPSPAKRPHTSPPAATPGGCRAWQSGATAPGSR